MPRYNVFAHRRVLKFLKELDDEESKGRIKEAIQKLVDYPLALRENGR
jgi:mRNA-degrading endonuclease RelE of RelBE toxin-antitoxin system